MSEDLIKRSDAIKALCDAVAERDEYYASMAESMAQDLWNIADTPQTDCAWK